jgi:hypothetical protein
MVEATMGVVGDRENPFRPHAAWCGISIGCWLPALRIVVMAVSRTSLAGAPCHVFDSIDQISLLSSNGVRRSRESAQQITNFLQPQRLKNGPGLVTTLSTLYTEGRGKGAHHSRHRHRFPFRASARLAGRIPEASRQTAGSVPNGRSALHYGHSRDVRVVRI